MIKKRGFTLIETFVAISILLLAVVGPLTLATRSLFSALVARDQLTASYLAQDAVEYIRYKRDNNFLAGNTWLDGSLSSCIDPKVCQVDTAIDTIVECGGGSCPILTYDSQFGFYGYDTDDPSTPFKRSVTLSPSAGNPEEYIINVTVSWRTGSFEHNFTTREYIYNWY